MAVYSSFQPLAMKISRWTGRMPDSAVMGLRRFGRHVVHVVRSKYLSGPYPGRLSSGGRAKRGITFRVNRTPKGATGRLQAKFKGARIHELGGIILPRRKRYLHFFWERMGKWVRLKRVRMPKRPYLHPAMASERKHATRMVREAIMQDYRRG